MLDEGTKPVFARDDMELLLSYLDGRDETVLISGAVVAERLSRVVGRKLGLNSIPVAEGSDPVARLERFFDGLFDVEAPPAIPYSADELRDIFTKVAEQVRIEADAVIGTEDHDMETFYRGIAKDYEQIIARLPDRRAAIKAFNRLDTADREKIFWKGMDTDEARFFATTRDVGLYTGWL